MATKSDRGYHARKNKNKKVKTPLSSQCPSDHDPFFQCRQHNWPERNSSTRRWVALCCVAAVPDHMLSFCAVAVCVYVVDSETPNAESTRGVASKLCLCGGAPLPSLHHHPSLTLSRLAPSNGCGERMSRLS